MHADRGMSICLLCAIVTFSNVLYKQVVIHRHLLLTRTRHGAVIAIDQIALQLLLTRTRRGAVIAIDQIAPAVVTCLDLDLEKGIHVCMSFLLHLN